MPLGLIFRNLFSRPLRTGLTMASLAVALFLLCLLRAFTVTINAGVRGAEQRGRLIVQSAVSLFVNLPIAYQSKILAVDGVEVVNKWQWFGGYYKDQSNFFAQFGTDATELFKCYPEIRIVAGSKDEFLAGRTACLIGHRLADEFGWKVGDTVPIIGALFRKDDGTAWEFTVAGIYEAELPVDNRTLFFHFDYLREALESGVASGPPGCGVFVLKPAPGANATVIMREVDALFENGPLRVQTTTEAEFNRQFVSMLGNIPTLMNSIGAGVLFAIAVAALNTMLMAGRERTRDLGIMKALGFGDGVAFLLLLVEGVVLCLVGGGIGVAVSLITEPFVETAVVTFFPGYAVEPAILAGGVVLSIALGFLAGALPAWVARRLKPVQALRAE